MGNASVRTQQPFRTWPAASPRSCLLGAGLRNARDARLQPNQLHAATLQTVDARECLSRHHASSLTRGRVRSYLRFGLATKFR